MRSKGEIDHTDAVSRTPPRGACRSKAAPQRCSGRALLFTADYGGEEGLYLSHPGLTAPTDYPSDPELRSGPRYLP